MQKGNFSFKANAIFKYLSPSDINTDQDLCYKSICLIKQVAWNKSSLLPKMHMQTLQLFTMIIKTESVYKSYYKHLAEGLRSETKGSN
jgi:hypothetical protein